MRKVGVNGNSDCVPVLIAIGANLGNPESKIQDAFRELKRLSSGHFKQSSLWKSAPLDCPEGSPDYINAAVSFTVQGGTQPVSFLEHLLELEDRLGRRRSGIPNEARVIDLDLICFGSVIHHEKKLILPHPRAHLRNFVLAPLAEIEPTFVIPGQGETVSQLLENLATSGESSGLNRIHST